MSNLFFNFSFDLGGIALILFVVWFFVNFNNSAAAFKWFSLSILTLLASIIVLSYGSTNLAKHRTALPNQNQTEITNLKRNVAKLKANKTSRSHDNKSESPAVPSRIANANDNQLLKSAVKKHPYHITLIAKVISSNKPVIVRGVHSNQIYKIHGDYDQLTNGEFVIAKGTATGIKNGKILIKTSSVERQPNS